MNEKECCPTDGGADKSRYIGRFYGTGAAEGIPNPFCGCYLCEFARKHGGKNVRTRSMFRLSEQICIDMGADAFVQANKYGDLKNLEYVLITHTHPDHFSFDMMDVRKMATCKNDKALHFYLTEDAYTIIEELKKSSFLMKGKYGNVTAQGNIETHKLEFFKKYAIGDIEVIPFKGNHFGNMGENSANYLIYLANDQTIYYGCDTGMYPEETFEALKDYKIDILISECSYGAGEDSYPNPGHLSYTTCLTVFKRLFTQGTIDRDTKVYLTHINHCHRGDHDTLQQMFDTSGLPFSCTVAYDGMAIPEIGYI